MTDNLKMEDLNNNHHYNEIQKMKRLCTEGDESNNDNMKQSNNMKQSTTTNNQININQKKKNMIKSQPKQRGCLKQSQNRTYQQTGTL